VDSPRVQLVKHAFRLVEDEGLEAGIEWLLSISHPDCEFRPYSATGRVLRGTEEVRAFFSSGGAAGRSLQVSPKRFEEEGDEVIVTGSIRLHHPAGGFAESQVRWAYRFRDDRVVSATWLPRYDNSSDLPASAGKSSPYAASGPAT
jgi:ketosteroid isomerase-like protein